MLRSIAVLRNLKLGRVAVSSASRRQNGSGWGSSSSSCLIHSRTGISTRQLAVCATATTRSLHLGPSRFAEYQEVSIDGSLLRLDQEIRRTGRVARQEIDEILQDVRDMNKATSNQSLMILRCCGELVPSEKPENRTKLVQEVWKTMENLNVPIDISHYNALLRVYLENEYKFNPTEILQDIANKGIEPNRVTYQRLIARYCQEGDIDGASTILQHMKEKQLPINEYVFNSLVNGHAVAGDMESAEGMIAVMKQAGLEPNDDTYVTLMCGYARKGDLESIKRVVTDCHEKEVHLIDRDFLGVIYVLVSHGHADLIDAILPMLKKQTGFNQDATNLVLRLVSIGQLDVAYRMLKEMPKMIRNEDVLPSGNFFIQHMVKCADTGTIIKYCKVMQEDGINSFALSKACDVSLQLGEFDKAPELFLAFKETGASIRQHFFWPFFAQSKSEKDVYNGLRAMRRLEMSPSSETLREYVIPALFKLQKERSASVIQQSLEKLSSYTGIGYSTIIPAALVHLLSEKNIEHTLQFATNYRLNFNNQTLRKAINDMYFRDRNASAFVRLIGSSGLDGEDNAREAVGQMILEVMDRARGEKAGWVTPIFNALLEYGIGLSNSGAELIQNHFGDELTPELTAVIDQLTSGDLTPKLDMFPMTRSTFSAGPAKLEDKSVSELERMLETEGGKSHKSIKKALLFAYCRQKNLSKAEALKKELDAEGFVYGTGLQALLLDMYSQCNKLEEAKAIYNSLKDNMDGPLDDIKILNYAGVLATNDLVEECLDFLKNTTRDEHRKPSGAQQQASAWKLLNATAEKGDVENLNKIFNCLRERNLIHVNNVTLGPLVKAHLVKDDLEGAVAEFERCVKEHHATPWKQDLFCRFINKEDADRLQHLIDLSTTLHGEVNTMYDLVFAFIKCGKLRQAKKILETPGLRARNDKIESTCQKYLDENRSSELENLIEVTRDFPQLDRSTMYYYLLQLYCKANDPDKALSIWTSLQEENIQPPTDLLIYLANFLRRNDRAVPFIVPEEIEAEVPKASAAGSVKERASPVPHPSLLRMFRKAVEDNQVDEALQIKQRLEGGGGSEKLSIDDVSFLIHKLGRAERLREATTVTEDLLVRGSYPQPRVLRFLLGRLAQTGDMDALSRLEKKLSPDIKRLARYNSYLSFAFTNAGRGREYFEKYIKESIDSASSAEENEGGSLILAGSTFALLRNEDMLPEYEAYAAKAAERGNFGLYNSLWNFHLIKKNFDKAQVVWTSQLKSLSRVMFRSVLTECKKNQDEEVAKELGSHLSTAENVNNKTRAVGYSSLISILCTKGKPEEALKYLEGTLQQLKVEDFPLDVLHTLKDSLSQAGKQFPYAIPEASRSRNQRRRADDSDSDSD